jgi:hypothetical protein
MDSSYQQADQPIIEDSAGPLDISLIFVGGPTFFHTEVTNDRLVFANLSFLLYQFLDYMLDLV